MTPSPRHPFVESLRVQFPDLAPALDAYEVVGLLYVEVGTFSRWTADAFNAGDLETVRRAFAAVEAALEGDDDELKSALLIEVAEDFALGTAHERTARRMMPPRLRAAFDEAASWHAKAAPPSRSSR